MTVTTEPAADRWGIYTRPNRRSPWSLVVHAGDKAAAERLLIDLASTAKQSGDWKVAAVCMDTAGAGRQT